MIAHHPSEETLGLYAFGRLGAGMSLVMGAHLRACAHCRAAVEGLEAAAGALLETAEPTALPGDALTRTLDRLDDPAPPEPAKVDLDRLIRKGVWLPAAPGLAFKSLGRYADPGERLYLLKAKPGTALPEHGHDGCERLVVLEGAFDNGGQILSAGDFTECDETMVHQPGALSHQGCVCLAATDGRLKFTGLARLVQPLLGV